MRAAVAVVTWNGSRYVGPCLESVSRQSPRPDILVLDNGSTDDTVPLVRSFGPRETAGHGRLQLVVQSANAGYTAGANSALRTLMNVDEPYDLIALINQDVTLAPGWMSSVGDCFDRSPDAGAIGGKTFYPGGINLQHAGGHLIPPRLVAAHHGQHELDDAGRYDLERDVEFVTGAALALRVTCLERVGLFDEIFSPGYYEDVDLCARIRAAGWRVVYCPRAQASHVESASFNDPFERLLLSHRNRLIFAMDRLADAGFAEQFREAERAAWAGEPVEVLRALALAYFEVSIRLGEIAQARLPAARRCRAVVGAIGDLVGRLRAGCLAEIRQRRRKDLQPSS